MVTYLKLLASYISWKPYKTELVTNETSPLHQAVERRSSFCVVHELIKNGADINAEDKIGSTPLCNAIYFRKSEMICLFLYHGAALEFMQMMKHGGYLDSNLLNTADADFMDVTKILFNYCTVTDDPQIESYCHDLLNTNSIIGTFLVENSLSDIRLVKLFTIIYKINQTVILNFEKPFLLIYLQSCNFSTSSWLKCLYMILDLPFAADLVQQLVYCNNSSGCFSDLMCAFKNRNVESHDRTIIIWIWLSLGAAVSVHDITMAIMHFGYSEELEALIYGFNSYETHNKTTVPAIIDILALEDNYNFAYSILSSRYLYDYYDAQQIIYKLLNFFALSKPMKQQVLIKCQKNFTINWSALAEKFENLDNCPSLVELSRNQIRRTIKQIYVIKQPYEFYETAKSLNIPTIIKDIILFKKPIYNS